MHRPSPDQVHAPTRAPEQQTHREEDEPISQPHHLLTMVETGLKTQPDSSNTSPSTELRQEQVSLAQYLLHRLTQKIKSRMESKGLDH